MLTVLPGLLKFSRMSAAEENVVAITRIAAARSLENDFIAMEVSLRRRVEAVQWVMERDPVGVCAKT